MSKTKNLGYLDQKAALKAIETEERLSVANGTCCPRLSELAEVRKFVNLYPTGGILKVTQRLRSYQATLLGYSPTPHGWVMGVLTSKGKVKEISIDPKKYDQYFSQKWLEMMQDRDSKYTALVTPFENILVLSLVA